jgi:hypothetical protein
MFTAPTHIVSAITMKQTKQAVSIYSKTIIIYHEIYCFSYLSLELM